MVQKVFETKTGHCYILEDRIVLTNSGFAGNVYDVTPNNKIVFTLIVYVLLIVYFLFRSYQLSGEGDTVWVLLNIGLAAFLAFGVIKSINNSSTPVIYRKDIKNIRFIPAANLMRAHFEVIFTNEKGKLKKRLIMLPGSLSNGEEATQKAVRIMNEEGLLQ